MQPVISSVVKNISGREIRRAERGNMHKKTLFLLHPLCNISITKYFNYEPRFDSVFEKIIHLE